MALPKVSTPIYELELPSNGKKIRYRPFLVKEEKLLIIANESKDPAQITNSVKQVLTNCILDKDVDVEELATFDIEFLFLNLSRRSIDEVFELTVICPDDKVTEQKIKLNINDIKVVRDPKHTNIIDIGDGITVKLKYPALSQFLDNNFDIESLMNNNENSDQNDSSNKIKQIDQTFKLIASCIETISTDKGECYYYKDCTETELQEFIDSLTQSAFEKINEFLNTMPKLSHTVKFKNKVTKQDCTYTFEGLNDFLQ